MKLKDLLAAACWGALATPIVVLAVFTGFGLVFWIGSAIHGDIGPAPLMGMVYGGAVYAFFAAAVSFPVTGLLGLPLAYAFTRRRMPMTSVTVAVGGAVGAITLSIVALAWTWGTGVDSWLVILAAAIGGFGGAINARVITWQLSHNSSLNPGARRRLA